MSKLGFNLYLVFTLSWFLHLSKRVSFLGEIRFDLILIIILFILILFNNYGDIGEYKDNRVNKSLLLLIGFIIVATPFAKWPGSVVRYGVPEFLKVVIFFYFTLAFVNSEKRFKIFILFFLGCQVFRVFEPVYLHLTQGYWGSRASMLHGEEWMNRLSGSPDDIINPNGLAFVILTILPFALYLWKRSKLYLLISGFLIPILLYALFLTGSRSGLIGFVIIVIAVVVRSKRKILSSLIFLVLLFYIFSNMSSIFKDRYSSIIDSDTKNSSTFEGRIQGILDDLNVAMDRPIFGFGLGTSSEANYHYADETRLAHDLYVEVAEELGFPGLIVFLIYMFSVFKNIYISNEGLDECDKKQFIFLVGNAMIVWIIMDVVFSFASYGLLSYEWYFFGGLSAVYSRLVVQKNSEQYV